MPIIKHGSIGKEKFSGVFARKPNGFSIRFITETALLEWLGPNWSQADLAAVMRRDQWLTQRFCDINDDGTFGYSPVAIALIVALSEKSTQEERHRTANLILDWIEQRSESTSKFNQSNRK